MSAATRAPQRPAGAMRQSLLLSLCAARHPAALEQARQLMGDRDFDWQAWYRQVQLEDLAPLAYHALHEQKIVPAAVEARLRLAYRSSLARNLRVFHELEEILLVLAGAGVQVVLLKGASLVETVYGDAALRGMTDLDLLVHPDKAGSAVTALEACGYRRYGTELRSGITGAYDSQLMLGKRSTTALPVELHWSLLDSPYHQQRMPIEPFWQTAVTVNVGKASALVLGPERQILHLASHLVLHHGDEDNLLLWLNDIAEALEHYRDRLDWAELLRVAQECELVLPLQQVLAQLCDEWDVHIPADVLAQLQGLRASRAEKRIAARPSGATRLPAPGLWADLQDLDTWDVRLRFAWANVCPSPGYMRARYRISRPVLLPLYYPYRWLKGISNWWAVFRKSVQRAISD